MKKLVKLKTVLKRVKVETTLVCLKATMYTVFFLDSNETFESFHCSNETTQTFHSSCAVKFIQVATRIKITNLEKKLWNKSSHKTN